MQNGNTILKKIANTVQKYNFFILISKKIANK